MSSKVKVTKINQAICEKNLDHLRLLGQTEEGFVNDGLRRLVWPMLLLGPTGSSNKPYSQEKHTDEDQLALDVHRSSLPVSRSRLLLLSLLSREPTSIPLPPLSVSLSLSPSPSFLPTVILMRMPHRPRETAKATREIGY